MNVTDPFLILWDDSREGCHGRSIIVALGERDL